MGLYFYSPILNSTKIWRVVIRTPVVYSIISIIIVASSWPSRAIERGRPDSGAWSAEQIASRTRLYLVWTEQRLSRTDYVCVCVCVRACVIVCARLENTSPMYAMLWTIKLSYVLCLINSRELNILTSILTIKGKEKWRKSGIKCNTVLAIISLATV
jgi:hypothetical protein